MQEINTILGTISAENLGETLCHEHVICVNPSFRTAFKDKWFDTDVIENRAIELFKQAKDECGVQTIIDGTPIDQGRDIMLIKRVSEKSGINIIISTGVHCSEESFLQGKKPEKLACYFIDECHSGVVGTNIKPGILKCATGKLGITEINKILLTTMSITQNETGLPLFAHNEHSEKTAYGQIKLFEKNNVNLEKVVIGHCTNACDIGYLKSILKSGCFLGFDRIYYLDYAEQARIIAELIAMGYEDKLLVSHDFFAYYDYADDDLQVQENWGRDFTAVHKLLLPKLKSLGINERTIKKLTIDNPKKLLVSN